MHLDNIISTADDWLAIDPKGIVGPREFEIAAFHFVSKTEIAGKQAIPQLFAHRVAQLCALTSLDVNRLVAWVFVRLVLASCWMIEDNAKPDNFLMLLQAIFPNGAFNDILF